MSTLRYALYTGCTAKESTPELLKSTLAVAKMLDIELVTLQQATCCGASHLQDFDEFLSIVLNARNICYAEKQGLDIVTLCNTCQINLAMVNDRLKNDLELRHKVNEKLSEVGLEYKGTAKIKHFLYALLDDIGLDSIKSKVVKPLTGFNVAAFYGCHNIRPSSLQGMANSGENPYNPTSLDSLIVALGGKSVQYNSKNKCCGFHADLQAPQTSNKLTGTALVDALDNAADMMVTPCPLCHLNLDVKQKPAAKSVGREAKLPVLHMPQLVGLALGLTSKELGFEHHIAKISFA